MLLDNKSQSQAEGKKKVLDYLRDYTSSGDLDIVTGFFSINALRFLNDELNQVSQYRIILGNLLEERKSNQIIDLLSENLDIDNILELSDNAKKAIEFLRSGKVEIKTIPQKFCHAKNYIYKDPNDNRLHYYIIGSSNLTDSGIGMKRSSNIELNVADTGNSNDFKEISDWFQNLWDDDGTVSEIKDKDDKKVDCKTYFIQQIEKFFYEYTPEQLYYKVLYELFKDDIQNIVTDPGYQKEIQHLEDTVIYNKLYPFQQSGVLSLIKKLNDYDGAILADGVGLGKTWTALATLKYFELQGYKVVVFCPKKLAENWQQYKYKKKSVFEQDRLDYEVRYHTDLQDERLNRYEVNLNDLQQNKKMLIVLDESHNLRNDKSGRYQFFVEEILKKNKDVKLLMLSATPLNNYLTDVRNQFKLITKGDNEGFANARPGVRRLDILFREAQKSFENWRRQTSKDIQELIRNLPRDFFTLTDSLIIARPRKIIEKQFGNLHFPEKEKPHNFFETPLKIGKLQSFDDILGAIQFNLAAYKPSLYQDLEANTGNATNDPRYRERFLVTMMYMLMVKRLESSWFGFKKTVEKIYVHHQKAHHKIETFLKDEEDADADEITGDATSDLEEAEIPGEATLGKSNPVKLSDISHIKLFKQHIEEDLEKFESLWEDLLKFEQEVETDCKTDSKLARLINYVSQKQAEGNNQKVIIFTSFKDTAYYLFGKLKATGFSRMAVISGEGATTDDGKFQKAFNQTLRRFVPYTKLYKESDWQEFYRENALAEPESYEEWRRYIKEYDPETFKELNNPIDILITTDCLSEGQNLQDADCVINYDVHWNPVRLVQRFGRIDRIGSPNATIKGVNFWPAQSIEDYLDLKNRVEDRMASMCLVGSEVDEQTTPGIEQMIQNNPIYSEQEKNMMEQLNLSWSDIESSDQSFGFEDLSFEQFRQELLEFFRQNEQFFENIPNGVFSGFKPQPDLEFNDIPNGLIAALGYPKNENNHPEFTYDEVYLFYPNEEDKFQRTNNLELLTLLRKHKKAKRYIPARIEKGNKEAINHLGQKLKETVKAQASDKAVEEIGNMFSGKKTKSIQANEKLEDKFQPDNFDFITWFIVNK